MKKLVFASLLIVASSYITSHERSDHLIRSVDEFPMARVLERYKKDYNVSDETARKHEREFKRYFALCALYPNERLSMFSDAIDNLWHTFLLFTKEYHVFCDTVSDRFIHHDPRDEVNKRCPGEARLAFDNFAQKYMKHFHEMPDETIWGRGQKPDECEGGDKCCHQGGKCGHNEE